MADQKLGITPQAGRKPGDKKIFQFTPFVEDIGGGDIFQRARLTGLDTARITIAIIALHHLTRYLIMGDTGIGTGQGAELTIHTAGFIPSNDPRVFVFREGLGRTIHDAAGFAALPALGDAI